MAHYLKGARDFTINGGNFGDQYGSNPESCLDRLNHVSTAGINASNDDDCMDGTRVDLLKELYHWSKDITAPRIFWLDGMAGTGKSAVARSMCHFLHQDSLLGGSFFCSRNDQSCANVKYILPTLAWDLARQDSKYRDALVGVLQKDPDVACYSVERQVHHLLEVPFCNFEEQAPPIFVVDALDECTNPRDVRKLLETLFSISPQPPVKFFITSRSEPYIRGQFSVLRSSAHRILRLHDIENDVVEGDISLYLTRRLTAIRSTSDLPEMFPDEWPALKEIAMLTRRAGKLFIYAFTAIQYIGAHNHVERLEALTKSTVDVDGELFRGPLDAIYTHILSAALDPCTEAERRRTKQILAIILAVREPLALSDLSRLIDKSPSYIRICLDRIHAVIRVPARGRDDGIVSAFHKSFVDFLITPGHIPDQSISLPAGHYDLARRCMEIMRSKLHFNIFRCQTSYLPNSKQQLPSIPESLRYSCHHWAYHLSAADDPRTLLRLLEDSILPKFLFWLEVLSATAAGAAGGLASNLIMRTMKVVKSYQNISPSLVLFLQDANEFINTFRTIIDLSIPHIYLSAAPWLQQTSTLAEVLKPLVQNTVIVRVEGIERQQRLLLDLRGHASPVNLVSFSPDSSRIVSGSYDGTVKIWDATTGEEVMNLSNFALGLHTRIQSPPCIRSVKYSPDGSQIAFAAGHKWIQVLDGSMEENIAELFCLKGHTDVVTSVSFSQDGKHIVSCSNDHTVRVWDVGTHKMTLTINIPLVEMATFTPNGSHIVSGSHHGLQMWDTRTGESVLSHRIDSPLCFGLSPDGIYVGVGTKSGELVLWNLMEEDAVVKQPGDHFPIGIACIGIAPHGAWVANSSIGKAVQVMGLKTGGEIMAPLQGHTSVVLSIGVSPDGSRIVTGSKDRTICLWDASIKLGEEIPSRCKIEGFSRVHISPDARYIVARSFNGKMTVWDSRTTKEIADIKYESRHESFQLSPDGLCIVSCLQDGSVKLWNSTTGSIVRTLRSHRQPVHCVDVGFSSDGTRIFGTLREGIIYLWDAGSGEEVMKLSDTAPRSCANFSKDGDFLATAGGRITLWDVRTGRRVLTQNEFATQDSESISFICFSPDGSRIVSCGLFTIRTWNVATGEEVMTIQPSRLLTMCLSPDGKYIVSGSRSGEVQFWDAKTGEAILEVGHTDGASVCSIAVSSISESRIVTCSSETIRIRSWSKELQRC